MGLYINPKEKRKEAWLEENGKLITRVNAEMIVKSDGYPKDEVVVCLVNNGSFTAAAIADCLPEFEAFTWEGDKRPKKWYNVPRRCFVGGAWSIVE